MRRADYRVQLVDENGKADWNFAIVGDQVVDLSDANPGDVLVVQPDGAVAPDPPGAPGAHATTHELGGTDELLLDVSQVNGLGSAATHSATDFDAAGTAAALVDDLSGVTNAATARNNLGLGTAAVHAHSDYDLAGAAFAAQAAAIAASQPLDSDLTAIAALSTTNFGRSFLTLADAAAGRALIGLGTAATLNSGVATAADVPTRADARYVTQSLYDANTILYASTDDTPAALAVGASTFVGRKASGGIAAMTASEAKTVLAIAESDVANLVSDLALKAPLASPTFTGTLTAGTTVLGATTATSLDLGSGALSAGQINASAPILAANGSAAAPSIAFTSDADGSGTGIYRVGANSMGFVANGVLSFSILAGANISINNAADILFGTATGSKIATATNQKIALHGATPVIQRASAAQAAVATTAATNVAPWGFSQTQADSIVTLLNEIRAALVEKGLIKGSA